MINYIIDFYMKFRLILKVTAFFVAAYIIIISAWVLYTYFFILPYADLRAYDSFDEMHYNALYNEKLFGNYYYRGTTSISEYNHLMKSAKNDDKDALYSVSVFLANGVNFAEGGSTQPNKSTAINFLTRAARKSSYKAIDTLANVLWHGRYMGFHAKIDRKESVELLKSIAHDESWPHEARASALFHLAFISIVNSVNLDDKNKPINNLILAAEYGNIFAKRFLVYLYKNGNFIERDHQNETFFRERYYFIYNPGYIDDQEIVFFNRSLLLKTLSVKEIRNLWKF